MAARRRTAVPEDSWHLDKRIPIALIIALLAQFVGFVSTFRTMQADLSYTRAEVNKLTESAVARDEKLGRIIGIERDIKHITRSMSRLEGTLDRIMQQQFERQSNVPRTR